MNLIFSLYNCRNIVKPYGMARVIAKKDNKHEWSSRRHFAAGGILKWRGSLFCLPQRRKHWPREFGGWDWGPAGKMRANWEGFAHQYEWKRRRGIGGGRKCEDDMKGGREGTRLDETVGNGWQQQARTTPLGLGLCAKWV